jgi:hypothetical protein
VAPRQWRVSLDLARGEVRTSHIAACPEIAPECATTNIPPHEHHVRVGLLHYQLGAQYGLRENLQLSLRVPFDVKAQRVRYTTLSGAPYDPPYGDIHHRTESLRGIGDPQLGIDWSPRRNWIAGFSLSLPAGHIERDPIAAGRLGIRHEHIQFGSGTVQPALALQWSRSLGSATLTARSETRFSLYENREGFRPPATTEWSAGPTFRRDGFSVTTLLTGQRQTTGRWNGETDEGSGVSSGGLRLQLGIPYHGLTLGPAAYRELWSHGLDEQTFRQGMTWSLSVSRTFR